METTQTKTWTEIKLRNPDARLCQELNDIMDELGEKSATKAIEYLIHNHAGNKKKIQDQRDLLQLQKELTVNQKERAEEAEFKLQQIKSSYSQFTKVIGSIQDPGY